MNRKIRALQGPIKNIIKLKSKWKNSKCKIPKLKCNNYPKRKKNQSIMPWNKLYPFCNKLPNRFERKPRKKWNFKNRKWTLLLFRDINIWSLLLTEEGVEGELAMQMLTVHEFYLRLSCGVTDSFRSNNIHNLIQILNNNYVLHISVESDHFD